MMRSVRTTRRGLCAMMASASAKCLSLSVGNRSASAANCWTRKRALRGSACRNVGFQRRFPWKIKATDGGILVEIAQDRW